MPGLASATWSTQATSWKAKCHSTHPHSNDGFEASAVRENSKTQNKRKPSRSKRGFLADRPLRLPCGLGNAIERTMSTNPHQEATTRVAAPLHTVQRSAPHHPSVHEKHYLTQHTHTHTHNQPTKYMTTATVFRQTTLTRQRETTLKVIYAHCPPRVVLSSRCVVLLSRKQVSCCRGTNTTNERLNERRKQRSNEATKQRSNEAMNQRINESTKQRSNEPTKERSNEATKQRRNDGTKQRRNEATKQQRSNEATKERTKELKSES